MNEQNLNPINTGRRRFTMLMATLPLFTAASFTSEHVSAASRSEDLEARINSYIKSLRRKGIIRPDEQTAWSVYDFHTKRKLVSINENVSYQSASMIKPFIALAFFYKVKYDSRHYQYTAQNRRKMEAMIRNSNNHATNYFIRLLSNKPKRQRPAEVEKILKHHAPGIFRQTKIMEYIPNNGRTYRNKASARDYSRFLYALWHDDLPYSGELKRLMNLANRDRICDGVANIPAQTVVYDKTGTTAKLCGNMGIVEAPGKNGKSYPYTFIGIIDKQHRARNYGHWARTRSNVIRSVSGMVYADMKTRYPLV